MPAWIVGGAQLVDASMPTPDGVLGFSWLFMFYMNLYHLTVYNPGTFENGLLRYS